MDYNKTEHAFTGDVYSQDTTKSYPLTGNKLTA